jgi:hypothetical protein
MLDISRFNVFGKFVLIVDLIEFFHRN